MKTILLLLLLLPFLIIATKITLDLRKGAAGIPANIQIDTKSDMGTIPSTLWQNLSQGGEEATDMIKPVISLTRLLQPKLIRVDHLFDYYNVYLGPNNYDFSKLDEVVNSILLTGARPMLSLSYTTASMAKNGQSAGEPTDWDQWYQLVKATAHHYSIDKKIDGIYYEVWNEPDLFGGWKYNKSPSYLTLYTKSAQAVADGAQGANYKIGGPAITAFYQNWIKALLKAAAAAQLRLDFISWHHYSKNPSGYLSDFENLNQILTDYPQYQNIERIISEVGPNSEPDAWYDNQMSGIHLISLSTQLAGRIHRLFTFEVVDGPSPRSSVSSGWGLITHSTNGLTTKPRYDAIKFLNRLGGNRLSSQGDGSWVTTLASKNNQTIQVLLVNYDQYNSHIETVPLTFLNIDPGKYTLTSSSFLGNTTSKTITISTFRHSEDVYLEANTALLLELTPTF
jgi:hypothetical protein